MQRASMSDDAWQKDNVDAFLSFLNETIPMSTPLSSTEILQALFKEKYGDKNDQILLEKVSAPAPIVRKVRLLMSFYPFVFVGSASSGC